MHLRERNEKMRKIFSAQRFSSKNDSVISCASPATDVAPNNDTRLFVWLKIRLIIQFPEASS
jgi:hypothetical protein